MFINGHQSYQYINCASIYLRFKGEKGKAYFFRLTFFAIVLEKNNQKGQIKPGPGCMNIIGLSQFRSGNDDIFICA